MTAATGLYEQLKDDLGYLQLGRAAECFATLAEQARDHKWSHVEFLARLIAEQTDATKNRRLAARLRFARFPFRRTIDDFDFEFQPSIDRKLVDDLATLRFITDARPILFLVRSARLRQDTSRRRARDPRGRSRLPRLLHQRR
jgi:DNA replication protein DnaC